jgi:hypothetical protein
MRKTLASLFALIIFGGYALANMLLVPPPAVASYSGPGDITAFTAWYSCTRAYSAAVAAPGTNKACDVTRTSDSTTCTVLLGTDGNVDLTVGAPCTSNTQTVTAFCNSTTCGVSKLYDQTAGSHCGSASCDVVQATAANQPVFTFSCVATTHPCLKTTTNVQVLVGANNITPATGVVSLSFLGNRVAGTTNGRMFSETSGHNSIQAAGSANLWVLNGGTNFTATANTNAFHAANGVINGASSNFNIDGTETTGTITANTTAQKPEFLVGVGGSTTFEGAEGGFKDNTAWTTGSSGVAGKLCANQAAYYGTTAGTNCNP